jgi:hypothetical protein
MHRHLCTILAFVAATLMTVSTTQGACPKVLMSDGVDIKTQTDPINAHYWGQVIGVQGFFLDNVMSAWQSDVGNDPASALWAQAKLFQNLYAGQGVTDNFIKVAIYKPHEWNDSAANAVVVQNFAHAAALARFARFKGVAIDVEPYVPIWGGDAGGDELAPVIEAEGSAIGRAMKTAYPNMTLVVIGDPLYWASQNEGYHGGYGLSFSFLRGLLSAGFARVIAADERTYMEHDVEATEASIGSGYTNFFHDNHLRIANFSMAAGLWPLGLSYHDKSARRSPEEFERELRGALRLGGAYTWIYGFGSAWQTGGPQGKEPVTGNFAAFVESLHRARSTCER